MHLNKNMRPLHIIMPMAGEGSRFLKEGWTTPKPLIELKGIPLFKRAINSIHLDGVPTKYSFIVRQEHIDKYDIDKQIKFILPNANIFSVNKTTRGAVETCLKAEPVINDEDGILVMDCDLEFHSSAYLAEIQQILSIPLEEANGGLLVSFDSNLPKYSYAEVDCYFRVIRTAEKEVISSHALCGAYFFSTGKSFLSAAHKLLNEQSFSKPEYYVSLLYNYLLKNNEVIKLIKTDDYFSYGTPEELKLYSLSNN